MAFVVKVLQDMTDKARADQALSFLAGASALLAGSLDFDTTLASLAHLVVPTIADWCSIQMMMGDGSVRTLAVAHVDEKKIALARELGQKYPFAPTSRHGAAEVMRTGRPELIREIPDELLVEVSPDPQLLRILRELGLKSSMCVPLKARGHILGAITFVCAESGRRFDEQELALATELGARAAISIDNANLYSQAVRTGAELSAVLTQMTDAVIIADSQSVVTFANESANRIFGLVRVGAKVEGSRPEVEMETMDGVPLTAHDMVLGRAVRGEAVANFHWRVRHLNGRELVLQTSAVPLEGPGGEHLGAVTVSRDITEEYNFDRRKDAFLLSASHDLKNPLTVIKGIAQLLAQRARSQEGRDESQFLEGLDRVAGTASRMSDMINELLDVSRLEMGRPLGLDRERTDLAALVGRAVTEIRATGGRNEIVAEVPALPVEGFWDPLRIERVLLNLLSNAVKFSPAGGTITVRLWVDRGDAVLTVADRGVGIPETDVPYVFDQFRRGENVSGRISGSGIGLAGVKQIVEQHHGTIVVDSKENAGSTFTVRLPLRSPTDLRDSNPR